MIERKEKEEGVFISPIAYYIGDKKRFRSRMGAGPSIDGHICSYVRESECSVLPPRHRHRHLPIQYTPLYSRTDEFTFIRESVF